MLDQTTKQRINACRDILVGKVPDPKSQVEQITIALIYKFMDDMDRESVEMGGKASFFSGEYAQYSWRAIFDPRIGGHELIKLYGEAIEKMNQNSQIPQLFRDIFNNAYLPYRDPETLKLFLKEINNFDYGNSERLGDAFEYLLSFMGTQGDAGQFRTPRHIIDFIAEVVDPKKNETVLDPACGTAGFLISAYKHIIKQNDDGKSLTPDERKRLIKNFIGYDISPDMVRLSLVNLYLHGFQDPNIFEYDTLTSEDRWGDTVDVVLANPPFMTPKGGIRPHKRFSVQANKSEVLFIDYIAEHLNPGGRAGIIVPEGIIFQSSNAYKALRKMLIDDHLWAVVSLPAGVFNPYSGVKTSILLIDKTKAKQYDSILFAKIENDGFDLGAQRRAIDKNDLPEALKILDSGDADNKEIAHWVEKSKIEESGDWNLSGERYSNNVEIHSDWDLLELGAVIEMNFGTRITKKDNIGSEYPVYGGGGESFRTDNYNRENEFVIARFAMGSNCVRYVDGKFWMMDSGGTFTINENFIDQTTNEFIGNILMHNQKAIYSCARGNAQKNLDTKLFKKLQIPLPPLSVQEEIVAEIDGYQKIIDGARQVVDNYKPTIKIDPDWEMVKLEEVCELKAGGTPKRKKNEYWNGNIPWISSGELNETYIYSSRELITGEGLESSNATIYPKGSLLIGMYDTAAFKMSILKNESTFNQAICGIKPHKKINMLFLYLYLINTKEKYLKYKTGARQQNLSKSFILTINIPLPPLAVQQEIVTQIEEEQEMVNANKKLIEIFEQKVKDKIGEVWGE